ncbi:MAG: methylenetetrahydrofolate reductase [Pseudolysinimonas sp.]
MPEQDAQPTFSFELYPPRNAAAEAALFEHLGPLTASGPEFISVTYGANGSSRDASLGVLQHLIHNTPVESMAHITCVGSSYAEASALIRTFLDAGITSFLAVRGDPPAGVSEDDIERDVALGDLHSAGELVQLIHRVQTEREPYQHHEVPGNPFAKRIGRGREVTIAVAAFPNGHPRSRSRAQDIDTLLAKEAAGANLAITQLFFEADDYLGFVDDARAAGVTMRILPGIMPVLSVARLTRMLELSGESTPQKLLAALEAAPTPEAAHQVGVDACIALARDLLAGGAPGIHLYTFNRSDAPLAVLEGAGLLSTPTER